MSDDPLLAPVEGARREVFAGMAIDVVAAGEARVKRIVYPPGMRWSADVRPLVGGELCRHAHVGFLARGHLQGEYADGCTFDLLAPRMVVIEPGHDAWVIGDEPAVLVQVDFERDTAARLGLPDEHGHAEAAGRPAATAARFSLTIDGVEIASFAQLDDISSSVDVVEYTGGSDPDAIPRSLPGRRNPPTITLRRGLTSGTELWQWHDDVVVRRPDIERDAELLAISADGLPVARFDLQQAWPMKVQLAGRAAPLALVESVTLVCQHLQRVAP